MPTYDFKELSPSDFEDLARGLLQEELGVTLETFVAGADNGIDLRHISVNSGVTIIQAKHYAGSTFSDLKTSIKKEATKLAKLKPVPIRYILATSMGLTPARKLELFNLLTPYILSAGDIIGQSDLNNLLDIHPVVERRTYKLWITSTNVLERVLHNTAYVNAEDEAEKIERTVKLFVDTGAMKASLDHLNKHNLLIITGAPGIGKSTLARSLAWHFMTDDWQLIPVESFEEADNVFNRNKKQVFFFDDFMGQIRLTPDTVNKVDHKLLKFIDRLKTSHNSRFILTSREYIIKQAQLQSEKISHSSVDLRTYTVDVGTYNKTSKTRILYNHIYFSSISSKYKRLLIEEAFYLKIIDHKNFAPRVIEFITSKDIGESIPLDGYQSWIIGVLDNPSMLWMHPYQSHLSRTGATLIAILFFASGSMSVDELKTRFVQVNSMLSQVHNYETSPFDFDRALKESEGTFINILNGQASFPNPSLTDFLDATLAGNIDNATILLCTDDSADIQAFSEHVMAHISTYMGISSAFNIGVRHAIGILASEPLTATALREHPLRQKKSEIVVQNGIPTWSRLSTALSLWSVGHYDGLDESLVAIAKLYSADNIYRSTFSQLVQPLIKIMLPEFDNLSSRSEIIGILERVLYSEKYTKRVNKPDLDDIYHMVQSLNDLPLVDKGSHTENLKALSVDMESLIRDELDSCRYSAGVDEVRQYAQQVAEFASIDISDFDHMFDDREQHLMDEEADREYEHDWGDEVPNTELSNKEIDSLFDTLSDAIQ